MSVMCNRYYSANSKTTWSMQLRKYFSFIDEFKGLLSPITCLTSQVAFYIVWLSKSLKYSAIINYLSALNFFLKAEGSAPIDYSSCMTKTVMGRAKRVLGCLVKRATPLLPAELLEMFLSCQVVLAMCVPGPLF